MSTIRISDLDHLVLTVKNISETCRFYTKVLGLELITYGEGRKAIKVGLQQINLHQSGSELMPCALNPSPGSADLCFITHDSLEAVTKHLKHNNITIEIGPIRRHGSRGEMTSLYFRDPDGNLLELSRYL